MALSILSRPRLRSPASPMFASSISQAERDARLEAERRSAEIDRWLQQDKLERARNEPHLRILLLGQAESGKSTTLKAFKLQYAPLQFAKELQLWTAVILYNLVASVNLILDTLREYELDQQDGSRRSPMSPTPGTPLDSDISISKQLLTLRLRLGPFSVCESSIRRRIDPSSDQSSPRPFPPTGSSSILSSSTSSRNLNKRKSQPELTVRALGGHDATLRSVINSDSDLRASTSRTGSSHSAAAIESDYRKARDVIEACADDVQLLIGDETVKAILKKYKMDAHLAERSMAYFLAHSDRIASKDYIPNAEDVLRARLKTYGAVEHCIKVEHGQDEGKQWLMIDVGGCRKQRHSWIPFFDNVHSIIFLAPVSTFNEDLEEDKSVNRLEDTVILWRDICSAPLLGNVHMILFLNKVDILERKLSQGIRFEKWVESYRGKNEIGPVIKYLQIKFTSIHRQQSPKHRELRIFTTSVIDAKTTPKVLSDVRAAIVKNMLEKTGMI